MQYRPDERFETPSSERLCADSHGQRWFLRRCCVHGDAEQQTMRATVSPRDCARASGQRSAGIEHDDVSRRASGEDFGVRLRAPTEGLLERAPTVESSALDTSRV
jgi:hypothetical protein